MVVYLLVIIPHHYAVAFFNCSHTWAEQLVPVLTSAQTKLADRVSRHRGAVTRDNLEPAAHLDPGPDGYNVYGRVGHALGLVSVPLDIDSSLKRLAQCDDSPPQECGKMLSHARRLLTIYLGQGSKFQFHSILPLIRLHVDCCMCIPIVTVMSILKSFFGPCRWAETCPILCS